MKNRSAAIVVLLLASCAFPAVGLAFPSTTKVAQADASAGETTETETTETTEATETATASLLDGVFTEEQAKRGQQVYRPNCTGCHGGNLRGSPGGPALAGSSFERRWEGQTLADIYTFIHDNMPAGRGGSLTDEQYIDVTAFILSKHGFPAGDTELPPDPEFLAGIPVVEKP